jgi:hypothetical protein
MTMKNLTILTASLSLVFFLAACDENEVLPDYTKKGTATATVASITASNAKPVAAEEVTLTLTFVNPSADPLKTVVLKAQVGTGDYTEIESFDEQSGEKDKEVTRTVTYVAPASGTKVTFDMVITSQKEYPQVKRTSFTVQ